MRVRVICRLGVRVRARVRWSARVRVGVRVRVKVRVRVRVRVRFILRESFFRCRFSALCAEPKSLQFFARNRSPVWGRALDCTTHVLTHLYTCTL